MKYLADVNVLSEPTKSQAHSRVVRWLQENQAEIVVDPIVMGELWEGIVAPYVKSADLGAVAGRLG